MKRKREHTFFPLSRDQNFDSCTHNGNQEPLIGERTSSGRTSTESVLSPQTSSEILKERGQLCQFFSPIPRKSFSSTRLNPYAETDSDKSTESDDKAHAVKHGSSAFDLHTSDYGYFTDPHAETKSDTQPRIFESPISPLPGDYTAAANNQTLVIPKPRKASTVYDFCALLEALPDDKDPADKKRIT